jgi:hypothetical protein
LYGPHPAFGTPLLHGRGDGGEGGLADPWLAPFFRPLRELTSLTNS